MSIEDDARQVLLALASYEEKPNDPDRGQYSLERDELVAATRLRGGRLQDAVDLLDHRGWVERSKYVDDTIGDVGLNARGRLEAERLTVEREAAPAAAEDSADGIPKNPSWNRRWWRVPGETFLDEKPIDGKIVSARFTSCRKEAWGVATTFNGGTADLIFSVDVSSQGREPIFVHTGGAPDYVVRIVGGHLMRRLSRCLREGDHDPILVELAKQFRQMSWVSGARLRQATGLDLANFEKRIQRLMPRYVRKNFTLDAHRNSYGLTLPGLLHVDEKLGVVEMIEKIYQAIAYRFGIDPDSENFDRTDLAAVGLSDPDLKLIGRVAEVCLLIGAHPDAHREVFTMPADAEAIAEAARKKTGFRQYLVDAATEAAQHSEHYPVQRPWETAPLWLERDHSQPDFVPRELFSIPTASSLPATVEVADSERPHVPGYVLLEALPGGAGGEVYLARENREGGVERVIKLFMPHPFAAEQDPEPRFRSEVEAILRLQHKSIVRYVSSGVLEAPRRIFYLVMEFVKGSRLQTRAAAMSFELRVSVMIEILDGLEHAHSKNVFHRDIKPSNIMIRESDNQPVLVDFGLAYLVGDELDDDRTRAPLGTPGYIPPEVSNAPKKSRDPRHDVYQAGVTLYTILAGHLPQTYIPLELTDSSLRGLDPIVKRALADPVARFATAAAFAEELRGWVEQQSRRRMLPPSSLTQRVRESLLARRAIEAQHEQVTEARAQAIRNAMRPIALTVEAAAIDAFRELHEAIADLLPFDLVENDLTNADAPEDERGVRENMRICSLVHRKIERSIIFSRAHRGVDIWKTATKQFPKYGELIHDGRLQFPAWVLWTTGSQSPNEIANAVIYGLRADAINPHAETTLVGLRGTQTRALEQPSAIKDYVIEMLAAILDLNKSG